MPEATKYPALVSIARDALLQMTSADTIGELVDERDDGDGIVTLYFTSEMVGYPGWRWTVSLSNFDDQEPSVLETELTPGDGALLAPDWVPWSDRLADYKAAQEGEEAAESDDDESDDDDDSDDDESDESEEDEDDDLGSDILHGGDVDGVDIDEALADVESDDDDPDDDDPDDDESSEDDDDDDESDDEDAEDPEDEGEKTY